MSLESPDPFLSHFALQIPIPAHSYGFGCRQTDVVKAATDLRVRIWKPLEGNPPGRFVARLPY